MKLLDAATVENGDGNWVSGYEIGADQCGLVSAVSDTCNPSSYVVIGGSEDGTPLALRVTPFAVLVRMNERTTFCSWQEIAAQLDGLINVEKEKAAGHALWFGSDAGEGPSAPDPNPRQGETWLGNAAVTSVAAGSDDTASLADALAAFYAKTVGVEPVIHLGTSAALRMAWIDKDSIRGIDAPVVINPGYDPDGIAITGPVRIRFGNVQKLDGVNTSVNRVSADANVLGAIEFDPCAAVVVGPLPTHPNQS
jgi:hypothetical protein